MSLPTTRKFITQLLESLPSATNSVGENVNPLSGVPESAKNQLLSLQVLFPNEFLPALDLLDRSLVTRLRIADKEDANRVKTRDDAAPESGTRGNVDAPGPSDVNMEDGLQGSQEEIPTTVPEHNLAQTTPPPSAIYYVRSAQQRSSRFSSSYDSTTSYEVRLLAWTCSCPAFAFAAFPAVHPEPAMPMYDAYAEGQAGAASKEREWAFGGMSLGDAVPPVCKHLLACVLVERCWGLFGGYVEEREVCVEEAAGWAAGWGDS